MTSKPTEHPAGKKTTVKAKAGKAKAPPVAWTKLQHARGKATNVATLLAGLRLTSKQEASLQTLVSLLASEGKIYSATPAVIAPLVEIAVDQKVSSRHDVVDLLVFVLTLGNLGALSAGVKPPHAEILALYARHKAKNVLEAAHAAEVDLLPLLRDGDPRVRASTARFFGLLPDIAPGTLEALSAQLAVEKVHGARVSLLLAHGERTEPTYREAAANTVADLRAKLSEPGLVRGMAAAAETIARRDLPAGVTIDTLSEIFDFFAVRSEIFHPYGSDELEKARRFQEAKAWSDEVAWNDGRVDMLALHALAKHAGPRAREVVIGAVAKTMSRTRLLLQSPMRAEWPDWVLGTNFRERALLEDPVRPGELDERQRALLADLSRFENEGAYASYGLPPDARSRLRLVGRKPPHVLERVLVPAGGKPKPVWRLVLDMVKAAEPKWKKQRDAGAEEMSDSFYHPFLATFGLTSLSRRDWLDVWMELRAGAYDGSTVQGKVSASLGLVYRSTLLPTALDRATSKDRQDFVQVWAEEARQFVEAVDPWPIFYALKKDLKPGGHYPEGVDDVFTHLMFRRDDLREMLQPLPAVRRERIVQRLIEQMPAHELAVDMGWRITGECADLAPRAAAAMKALLDQRARQLVELRKQAAASRKKG